MNIEEERKAFEATLFPETGKPVACVSFVDGKYRYSDGREAMTQDYFDVWLKAKAHAEEMAKPEVVIMRKGRSAAPTGYPFNVCLFEGETFNGVLEDFRTREDAERWAKDNGYRVVSE